MPCHTRMKILPKALLWLYIWGFSFMVASLEPGFLDFDNLPDTNFSCVGKVIGGYYADLETSCQMFHVCTIGQLDEPMDIRFLCLNGTVFDQETRVCERIDEVDCSKSEQFYSLNLELYGNTQPPILEDNSDTDPPDTLKHSSTSTTTTTPRPTKPKTTRPSFIITTTQKPPSTTLEERFLQSHHFPGSNSADIRFNPEEINISLNPGAPPNIRSKPVSFQQSITDNNKRVIVTTHTTVYKTENNKPPLISTQNPQIVETQKPKTIVNYDLNHDDPPRPQPLLQLPGDDYNFNAYQTDKNLDYETEIPHHEISFRPSFRPSSRDIEQYTPKPEFKSSTYRTQYHSTTIDPVRIGYSQRGPTTYRNSYSSPLKPALPYYHRTDKPPRIQLPLPLIPTLSPLTFSSPAPFTLNKHVESKRFTDHHEPPRIVISASASVSDASGRKFNYSLGTIGDSRFFGQAPHSYDDYKEDDVGLDPFYHDVPKLKRSKRTRQKRSTIEQTEKNIRVEDMKSVNRNIKQRTTTESKKSRKLGKVNASVLQSKRSKPNIVQAKSRDDLKREDNLSAIQHYTSLEETNNKRNKRRPQDKSEEEIKSEKEAIDVLKFLFNWYNSHEKMSETSIPIKPETITEINKELSNSNDEDYYYEDYDITTKLELQKATPKPINNLSMKTLEALERIGRINKKYDSAETNQQKITTSFVNVVDKREQLQILKPPNPEDNNYRSQYNISEGVISVTEAQTEKHKDDKESSMAVQAEQVYRLDNVEYEYVDDNYEPQTYNLTNGPKSEKDYDYDYLVLSKEASTGKNIDFESFKEESTKIEKNDEIFASNTESVNAKSNSGNDYENYDNESSKRENENERSYDGINSSNGNNINQDAESNTPQNTDLPEVNTEKNNDFTETDTRKYIEEYTESNTQPNNDNESTNEDSNIASESHTPTYDSPNYERESSNDSENQNIQSNTYGNNEDFEPPTITENYLGSTTETTSGTTEETTKYGRILKILGITTSKPSYNKTFDEIPILTPDVTTVSYEQNTEDLTSANRAYNNAPIDNKETTDAETIQSTETTLSTDQFTTTLEDLLTITQPGITEFIEVQTTPKLLTTTARKHGRNRNRNYNQNKRGKAKKYRKFVEVKQVEHNEQLGSTITTEKYSTAIPTTPDLQDITTKLMELNEYGDGIYSREYKQYDDVQSYQNTQKIETTINDNDQKFKEETVETITTESMFPTITTDGNQQTDYDTTLNTLYTTVQLQDFIENVESNTNSIADTKNLTDTTIEITTVNIDDDPTTQFQITTVENTTPASTTTTRKAKKYESRGVTGKRRNRYGGVHRFSGGTTVKPRRRKPSITEEIVDVIKNRKDSSSGLSTRKTSRRKKIEFNINAYTANLAYRNRKAETTEEISVDKNVDTTEKMSVSSTHKIIATLNSKPTEELLVNRKSEETEENSVTVASFSKSANPTIAKNPKDLLPTTPLSKSRNNLNFVFNCFGKAINKFYSDPRDCRLFHYCTKGFTKTQLLDMKFVCDLGTFFDSEKLICTKDKPTTCT